MAGNYPICFFVCYYKPKTSINFINMHKNVTTYTLVAVWYSEGSQ